MMLGTKDSRLKNIVHKGAHLAQYVYLMSTQHFKTIHVVYIVCTLCFMQSSQGILFFNFMCTLVSQCTDHVYPALPCPALPCLALPCQQQAQLISLVSLWYTFLQQRICVGRWAGAGGSTVHTLQRSLLCRQRPTVCVPTASAADLVGY
jgi:hypothetical protein